MYVFDFKYEILRLIEPHFIVYHKLLYLQQPYALIWWIYETKVFKSRKKKIELYISNDKNHCLFEVF